MVPKTVNHSNSSSEMLPGVGIFGTSNLARRVTLVLKSCGFEINAVWSRTTKDAQAFAADLGIPFHTNKVDGLLLRPEVGFVVIVCPPHLQSPIAVKALSIGKHVIATPPAGTSQLEVLKMVNAAKYYPALLSMTCHGLRFLPTFTNMRRLIADGYIGDLFLFEVKVHTRMLSNNYNWESDVLMGGGALSMHGSYVIDVLQYLSGKHAESVHGLVKTYVKNTPNVGGVREITSDDFCSFQMELEGGASATCILNNHCHGEYGLEVTAIGSKGQLMARDLDLCGRLNDGPGETVLHYDSQQEEENHSDGTFSARLPFGKGFRMALTRVANAFLAVDDIHGWQSDIIKHRATFEDSLYVQTVVDAIRKSSADKCWVKIEILSEEPDPNPHLSSVVRRSAFASYY